MQNLFIVLTFILSLVASTNVFAKDQPDRPACDEELSAHFIDDLTPEEAARYNRVPYDVRRSVPGPDETEERPTYFYGDEMGGGDARDPGGF